ncbi:ABC transporter permease [Syntrophomonas erecta]
MKKLTNTAAKNLAPGAAILALLVFWEAVVRWQEIPPYILPSPLQVIKAISRIGDLLYYHTSTTLLEALLGLFLSIVVAFLMAFLLHNVRWLNEAVYPLLIISQTIPLVVLAVLLPLWFGWSMLPKVLLVVLVCFFPVVLSLLNGLNSVDPDLLSLFRSMGATPAATFRMVKLPAAIPSFFSGVRISTTYSIMAAVISEWVGAQRGLGYFMTMKQKSFAIDEVLAAVVIICLLSLILVKIVDLLEFLLIPWNRKSVSSTENESGLL